MTPDPRTTPSQQMQPHPKDIPMPLDWPVVGTLFDFMARGGVDGMSAVHESMYNDFGKIYKMNLVGEEMIVVSDPNVFDQVLRREGVFPVGGAEFVPTFKEYYEENDLTMAKKSISRGTDWKEFRMATNPDLYVLWDTYLPTIGHVCSKISRAAAREVTHEQNLSFEDFISRAAFDMFSAVVLGEAAYTTDSTIASEEDVDFVRSTQTAFDITGALIASPLDKLFGTDLYKAFVTNMDKTFAYSSSQTLERAERARDSKLQRELEQQQPVSVDKLNTNDNTNATATSGCPVSAISSRILPRPLNRNKKIPTEFLNPSFIERLVDRGDLSTADIAEIAPILLMAGVDTTAYVMSWFFLNIASNPRVQTKLANHLHAQLDGDSVTTVEQLESLTYLEACFRESHRLTPSAPISAKTLEQDIDLRIDNESYRAPADKKICLNLRGLPMDPNYVEDPNEFRPERFLPEAIQARKGTPSATALDHPYFQDPFGRGKRRCLGANIAKAEMMVLAARLLQDWEISLDDPNEAYSSPTKTWKPKMKLMLKADPYPAMSFAPRRNQSMK
jgi:cytochrome P450